MFGRVLNGRAVVGLDLGLEVVLGVIGCFGGR